MPKRSASTIWDRSTDTGNRRLFPRIGILIIVVGRTAFGAINPFHRKIPPKGPAGIVNLVVLLCVVACASGYMTEATGLRHATIGFLTYAENLLHGALRAIFLGKYHAIADSLAFSGRIAAHGLAILAVVAWVMNLGNFTEAAILGILATYQGKLITSVIEISMTFALPITLTWLLLSTDRNTCLVLLGFLAMQLIYLRCNIDAHLARQYLARIAAIRGGLTPLDYDDEHDDAT
jgi:hypothetical protein